MPLTVSEVSCGSCLQVNQTRESKESKADAKTVVFSQENSKPSIIYFIP